MNSSERQPLPVTIVTGFLGAGKTTLIRRLLQAPHGLRIGLVLNELGQAGIDVPPDRSSYLELTEGCACCVRNPDLIAALDELSRRGDLDRVVLETTGLADPLPLTWTIARPELDGRVRLDAVVTVVDPLNIDRARGEEWEAQVHAGDLLLFAKTDLASADDLSRATTAVRELNSRARLLEPGPDLAAVIFGPEHFEHARTARAPAARHSDFRAVTYSRRSLFQLEPLEDLLESLPEEVFRAKGIVPLDDGRWAAFHAVGGRLHLDLDAPPPAHGEARVVLFGRRLDAAPMHALLDACLAGASG